MQIPLKGKKLEVVMDVVVHEVVDKEVTQVVEQVNKELVKEVNKGLLLQTVEGAEETHEKAHCMRNGMKNQIFKKCLLHSII